GAVRLVEVHVRPVGVGLALALLLLLQLVACEGWMLRRDAGIDDADDDALTCAIHSPGGIPHTARSRGVIPETEEVGGGLGIWMPDLIREHPEHVLRCPQCVD